MGNSPTTEAGGDGAPNVQEPLAPLTPSTPMTDEERRARTSSAFWWTAAVLLRWKWFIVAITFLAAGASVLVALSLPVWFASTARVLPPESTSGGLGAVIGELSPIAASFVGGGGGDYTRYLAILDARSTHEEVIEQFDLVNVYDLADEPHSEMLTLDQLARNIDFTVDLQLDYLGITVFDQDPRRAAQMANYFVEVLNDRNEALALEGASAYRRYIEDRYNEAEIALDSARAELQSTQERYGVIELPAMAQGMMQSLASSRGEVIQAEIQYNALLSEFGPDNPQVQAMKEALATAQQAEQSLIDGQEAVMPVPMRNLPSVANEYARSYQDVLLQQAIIEGARPLLEQARFDEQRERTAVQVLDEAVAPVLKARPSRSFIVLSSTVAGGLLAMMFALAFTGYKRYRQEWSDRLAAEMQTTR